MLDQNIDPPDNYIKFPCDYCYKDNDEIGIPNDFAGTMACDGCSLDQAIIILKDPSGRTFDELLAAREAILLQMEKINLLLRTR